MRPHDSPSGFSAEKIPVSAITRAFPGRSFDGFLSFLFPHIDPETRTLTVRFELPNADHQLRPGMTAAVTMKLTPELIVGTTFGEKLRISNGQILALPEACIIDTGKQKIVYRESSPNTFDGVLVEFGPQMMGANGISYLPILKGLEPGDRIVAAGSFLIDAETRLNPALGSIYIGGSGSKGTAPVRPTTPEDEQAKIVASLSKLAPEDRVKAESQRFCPILEGSRLGSMDAPIKLMLNGQVAFVCCKGCVKQAQADPLKTLSKIAEFEKSVPPKGGKP